MTGPGDARPGRSVPPAAEDARPVGDLTFVEASTELDGIVARFERGEVDVDQLVRLLERASAIVEELDRRIRGTRAQVEALVPRLAALADGGERGAGPADPEDPDGGPGEG